MDQGTEGRGGGVVTSGPGAHAPGLPAGTGRPIALIERLDRDARVLRADPVYRWPVTLGRALDCDVVLDDPHVAAHHARLCADGPGLRMEVGQTVNGALVGHQRLAANTQAPLPSGQIWRLGTTRLRVRLAGEPVAPEVPLSEHAVASSALHVSAPAGWLSLTWMALFVLAWASTDQWLGSDPGTSASQYLGTLVLAIVGLAGWALVWSLGSKLFQERLNYWTHLRLALTYTVAWAVVTTAFPAAAFITGIGLLSRVSDTAALLVIWALVLAHLKTLLPGHQRLLTASLVFVLMLGIGLQAWLNHQRLGRWFSELYTATMLPPAWRLAPAVPPQGLIDNARALHRSLDAQAREDAADDTPEDD